MKLELLDAYNIRARLSASVILLAPIAITVFLCFNEVSTIASSSAFVFVLLAFTNYVPILQRRFHQKNDRRNYASEFLLPDDQTIDSVTKERYYRKLAAIDDSFSPFNSPEDTPAFRKCCDSAVEYLRAHTRDNHLVLEENINYGFCKNLFADKIIGIIICSFLILCLGIYAAIHFNCVNNISAEYYYAFVFNGITLLFWIFGITKNILKATAIRYAKTLIAAIDTL